MRHAKLSHVAFLVISKQDCASELGLPALQVHGVQLDVEKMAKRLWGDVYYHPTTRTFKTKPQAEAGGEATRTFVEFILEPLYKIYSQARPAPLLAPLVLV